MKQNVNKVTANQVLNGFIKVFYLLVVLFALSNLLVWNLLKIEATTGWVLDYNVINEDGPGFRYKFILNGKEYEGVSDYVCDEPISLDSTCIVNYIPFAPGVYRYALKNHPQYIKCPERRRIIQ
jgi:hypothetical protein